MFYTHTFLAAVGPLPKPPPPPRTQVLWQSTLQQASSTLPRTAKPGAGTGQLGTAQSEHLR